MAVQKRNHKLHETERNLRIFKATSHEPIALKLGQLQVELTGVILPFATCTDPWSDGSAKLELAIYYGEPNKISRLKISGGVTSDLGLAGGVELKET